MKIFATIQEIVAANYKDIHIGLHPFAAYNLDMNTLISKEHMVDEFELHKDDICCLLYDEENYPLKRDCSRWRDYD